MSTERKTVYDGQLFRVEELSIPNRELPYEFVKRIGAVTMLATMQNENTDETMVLVAQIDRAHYGTSHNILGGNRDGGFTNPEPPDRTAIRELIEETGYGYASESDENISMLRLRDVSSTIDYPRHLAIVRDVTYVGGEERAPHEKVTLCPLSLKEYIEPILRLERGETYPEINAAFRKAADALGESALLDWIATGEPESVSPHFAPWLIHESTI